jgi:pimeloyl-ACP methyl ester carboxylesterase
MMTFYAGVIADFIETLKLGPVNLAGHSMGGQILWRTRKRFR